MTRTARMAAPTDLAIGAGSLCLDFLGTVIDPRTQRFDALPDVAALGVWFDLAGLPAPVSGFTAGDLLDAHTLRAAIDGACRAVREGRRPEPEEVRCINVFAWQPTPVFLMGPSGRERTAVDQINAARSFSVIARDAINLLTGTDIARLRECDGCGSVFYDRSPSGRRRWCSMRRCGERFASASYRKRRAAGETPGEESGRNT